MFFEKLDPTIEDTYIKKIQFEDLIVKLDILDTAGREGMLKKIKKFQNTTEFEIITEKSLMCFYLCTVSLILHLLKI
jgi:hypothetical protein